MANHTRTKEEQKVYPLISPKERLAIWEKAREMWKDRRPNPIKELQKMRREWEREISPLRK